MPDSLTPEESSTIDRLEAYLAELHAGRRPDRARWVAEHPHLAAYLDTLDRLDALAPDPQDTATLPPGPPTSPVVGPPGNIIVEDRYELLGELGRGGMGVVYKARQVGLERVVALKMILAGSLASEEQHRRFQAEAKVAARVQHPHVVQVHETGQINGLPYLVMQYVEGHSLAHRLRSGPLQPDVAAVLVAAVARAVATLHAAGIVHRDLKPSNILLDANDKPYVTDFGLAKLVEGSGQATQSGTVLGTPQYMAPEQASGARDVGPAADVYALGTILYECLTGRPVVTSTLPIDALLAVLESEPPPPRRLNPKVPRSLEQVVLQCLDKQPSGRYPSAAALASALDNYTRGEPVPTRHERPSEKLLRWARREPALATRWTALVAGSLIVGWNYFAMPELRPLHNLVLLLFAGWAGASWVFQQGLRRPEVAQWSAYAWSATDVLLLTVLQDMTEAGISPLIFGYPFLIACAGLWTQVRMVWATTACCFLGYLWLAIQDYMGKFRPEHAPHPFHRHFIFLIALVVLGFVMSYQVQRIRALSRYYEGRSAT
jgi:serine/threonine-protein kinase